jgi:hypothetical protein
LLHSTYDCPYVNGKGAQAFGLYASKAQVRCGKSSHHPARESAGTSAQPLEEVRTLAGLNRS